jgi:hypothetical protein
MVNITQPKGCAMRCGRPRKNGHREPNGRIKRIEASERRLLLGERRQVADQPHRRGDTSQLCGDPLGRFVLRHQLPRGLYDAATEYAGMVRCFYAAKLPSGAMSGVPQLPGDDRRGGGDGVAPAKAVWLQKQLEWIEQPLQKLSPAGFVALKMLAVFEREIAPEAEPMAIVVLCELGSLLRKVGKR